VAIYEIYDVITDVVRPGSTVSVRIT